MGLFDRTVLTNNDQETGQTASIVKLETILEYIADLSDENYNYATGLVSSSVLSKLGWYNVKDYGAVGDGATDDTTAIQDAIDITMTNNGILYFPEGTYLLESQVMASVSSAKIHIIGAGSDLSIILVNNSSGGVWIESTGRESKIWCKDITFKANIKNAGTALKITQPEGGNQHDRNVVVSNVTFTVENDDDVANYAYFSTVLDITGAWRPLIRNVVISGPFGPGISDDLLDTSPNYKTSVGINIDGCYHPEIHDCYIWGCDIGISNTSTSDPGPEGFRMENTNIVSVKKALVFSRIAREPSLWVSNCHYNYRDRGLDISGAKLVTISNCIPYNEDTTPVFGGTPEDISLDNVEKAILTNNQFHYDGNPNRRNISILGTIFGDTVIIDGNIFNSLADKGIVISSEVTNCFILNNEFTGTITTEVDDASNSATIVQRDGSAKMRLESGAGSGVVGPVYTLYRNSESPTANDSLGQHSYDGNNSLGERITYAATKTVANDVTDASEDGQYEIYVMINGTLTKVGAFLDPGSTNNTSMFLLVNNGIITSLQRVTIGDADSGGLGYRVLRVPN